jgi:hypothetical protein
LSKGDTLSSSSWKELGLKMISLLPSPRIQQ